MGCGGGLVVSVLAFYSGNLSSNPAGILKFSVRKEKTKQKESGVGPSLKKSPSTFCLIQVLLMSSCTNFSFSPIRSNFKISFRWKSWVGRISEKKFGFGDNRSRDVSKNRRWMNHLKVLNVINMKVVGSNPGVGKWFYIVKSQLKCSFTTIC